MREDVDAQKVVKMILLPDVSHSGFYPSMAISVMGTFVCVVLANRPPAAAPLMIFFRRAFITPIPLPPSAHPSDLLLFSLLALVHFGWCDTGSEASCVASSHADMHTHTHTLEMSACRDLSVWSLRCPQKRRGLSKKHKPSLFKHSQTCQQWPPACYTHTHVHTNSHTHSLLTHPLTHTLTHSLTHSDSLSQLLLLIFRQPRETALEQPRWEICIVIVVAQHSDDGYDHFHNMSYFTMSNVEILTLMQYF